VTEQLALPLGSVVAVQLSAPRLKLIVSDATPDESLFSVSWADRVTGSLSPPLVAPV
jgi:hypothetical protein